MTPRPFLVSAAAVMLVASASLPAQGAYWQASRFSRDLHQLSACGEVLQRVDLSALGSDLRSAHVAPDGKIWVVPLGGSMLTIVDANGKNARQVSPGGSPFQIAFDKAGHAWVTLPAGSVVEMDATGKVLRTIALSARAPLGIAVDADGNKWIAHRVGPPGSISRIDATTSRVTNHPLPSTTQILPVHVSADFRGPTRSSHIWVTGDNRGAASLVEFDAAGKHLNTYSVGPSSAALGNTVVDPAGDIWVGDFRTGDIYQVDPANGRVKNKTTTPPNVLGLAIDEFGELWATVRVSFRGPQKSEVRRFNRRTRLFEVAAEVGLGTGSALGTRFAHAHVVDPLGDADRDGRLNFAEIAAGTSPFDACSTGTVSAKAEGNTQVGSTARLVVSASAASVNALAFALGRVTPGVSFPGVGCTLRLEPRTLFPFTVSFTGPSTTSISIPNNPSLDGAVLNMQVLSIGASGRQFSNVACFKIFK